jgi:hypothetical protein
MVFTEKEAKEKEGKWVRVIEDDEEFLDEGITRETRGQVVYVQQYPTVEVGMKEESWVVNIRFYPPGKPSVLIQYIGKEQYEHALKEEHADRI